MLTRRELLQTAAILGVSPALPDVLRRAASIDPELNSTFLDAEHVVILMQENRSFDHAFGSLRGVRGFRDPRVHLQPDGTPVWFQRDGHDGFIPPFRLDLDGTNVTWMGGNPHSWQDQVDARNGGKYDRWIPVKQRGDGFPMTMGFYTREDIPFYYDLADHFTVFDQAFCSSLTGTTPNRLFLWTGNIRKDVHDPARVENGDTDYGTEAAWTTFPERLERANVSWKVYQNEISIDSGLTGEEDAWLTNFTDNPLEWFTQYGVRFSKTRRDYLSQLCAALPEQLSKARAAITSDYSETVVKELKALQDSLAESQKELAKYDDMAWENLSAYHKALHIKGFTTNKDDPDYRNLEEHHYDDEGVQRKLFVPKGDVLYQFRKDAESGQLPAVSWLIASEHYSDHPASAWFGAWYVSETLRILTENPELWKKTVLILCYDENDGYFDHVPPFTAPHPNQPETGKTSSGIDTSIDIANRYDRNNSIGLGYRCPLVVASPWTRGGAVNSQVSDHTSIIRFVETWLRGKGIHVHESNISDWRRTICGDLTSAFRPFDGSAVPLPNYVDKDSYLQRIKNAEYRQHPKPGQALSEQEIATFTTMPFQERGTRISCPLPYDLEATIVYKNDSVEVTLASHNGGAPFNLYSYSNGFKARSYALRAGDRISDTVEVGNTCDVRIDGPNGFMRSLNANSRPRFVADAHRMGDDLVLTFRRTDPGDPISVRDVSYGGHDQAVKDSGSISHSTQATMGWYDVLATDGSTEYRFAGRLETGKWSTSDPAMA